jgi:AcrR family transcriptional regulator
VTANEPGDQSPGLALRAVDRSPLLQQRRARSMQQVQIMIDAAKRLICLKGSGFTTQELVRESGVARQTFYRHFGGKDQLLLATMEDLLATAAAEYATTAGDLPGPLDRLQFYVRAAIQALDVADPATQPGQFITAEHWRLHQLFPQEMALAARPLVDLFARELRAAQQQGLIAPADVEHGAELMVMLVRSVYHQYSFGTRAEPTSAIADRVWDFCLRGIGGSRGRGATEG